MKIKFGGLFFFLVIVGINCSCAEKIEVHKIKAMFGGNLVQILLYDVKPLFVEKVESVASVNNEETFNWPLLRQCDQNNQKKFDVVYESHPDFFCFDNQQTHCVRYAQRYMHISGDIAKYSAEGECRFVKKDISYTPVIRNSKNDHTDLFHLFPLEVDDYLLKYGILEHVLKRGAMEYQVTIFGVIKVKRKNSDKDFGYIQPGFFQYTFATDYANPKQFVCYHRTFRPYDSAHLENLTLSGLNFVWYDVLQELVKDIKVNVNKESWNKDLATVVIK